MASLISNWFHSIRGQLIRIDAVVARELLSRSFLVAKREAVVQATGAYARIGPKFSTQIVYQRHFCRRTDAVHVAPSDINW